MTRTTVTDILDRARQTHLDRIAVYGDKGYEVHAAVLKVLFPDGITLTTQAEFARWAVFEMIVAKLCRYATNYTTGGHADSVHDLGVYSFMLEAHDEAARAPHRG
jgi:hypothetical protein